LTEQDQKELNIPVSDTPEQTTQAREKAVQQRATGQPVLVPGPGSEAGQTGAEPKPVSVEEALKEAAENRDRWLRSVAELENYRKRTAQERNRLLKYKNEDLLRDLLMVVDNMERALGHCRTEGRSDALADGVCMISAMFQDVLQRYSVTEIKALGEPFNPHVHEALARVPTADSEPNVVIQVLEKGYMYQDRLLRPAKVAVSAAPSSDETAGEQRQ
jgi:molecular chaperone GrpE